MSAVATMGGSGFGYSGSRRRNNNEDEEKNEQLVNEVADYLLGISVG